MPKSRKLVRVATLPLPSLLTIGQYASQHYRAFYDRKSPRLVNLNLSDEDVENSLSLCRESIQFCFM